MIPCRHPPCPMATDPNLYFANEKSRNAHEWRYHNDLRQALAEEKKRAPTRRVAIYARVSTDQGEQDPEQQLVVCRRVAHERGWDIAWEGFDFVTGDSLVWERESGRKLWDLVKSGKVDAVLCYDASRLSRQHPVSVFKVLDLLKNHGVWFVSASEPYFDFSDSNPFRDIIVFLTAWSNNFFLRNLRAATLRGKEAAIRAGRKQGAHRKGCGRDFPCPTGIHDKTGRNVRARPKVVPKPYAQEILPQPSAAPAEGNGAPEKEA